MSSFLLFLLFSHLQVFPHFLSFLNAPRSLSLFFSLSLSVLCVLNTVFLSIQCFFLLLFWHWGAFSLHTHTHETRAAATTTNEQHTHTIYTFCIFCILYQCQDFCSKGNFIYLRHRFIVSTTNQANISFSESLIEYENSAQNREKCIDRNKRMEIYLFANITAPENGNKTRRE